jgi:undecaprenyl-diphosphatase
MLTYTQAAILGFLQGITELFPISSLGHSVLVPELLHWQLDQASSQFVAFVVATHLATALVLLGFFRQDWVCILIGILRSLYLRRIDESDTYAKLGWLLVVGTIPAGLVGLLLETKLQTLFGAGMLVAIALMLNGIVLYGAERLRKRVQENKGDDGTLARLSYLQAFGIGIAQSFALLPGISRTGSAMTGGLLSGLSHEGAARFAFLLATPIILAAAVLKLSDMFSAGASFAGIALIGALSAAVAAYISVRFLVSYFKTRTLTPFAIYCALAGAFALLLLAR